MCLKTCSSGRPKPCEEIWVDGVIIEKCIHSEIRDLVGLPWYGCTRSLRCPNKAMYKIETKIHSPNMITCRVTQIRR